MLTVENDTYFLLTDKTIKKIGDKLEFPQILVSTLFGKNRLFEIQGSFYPWMTSFIPVLPGSVIDEDGVCCPAIVRMRVDKVRLPTSDEVSFYDNQKNRNMTLIILNNILNFAAIVAVLVLCYRYARLAAQKENEYYTDYVHNGLILRIYKPEFEYQAIGKVPIEKILDRGTFSQYYLWALIEK